MMQRRCAVDCTCDSVGEVISIGRTFCESLQKAARSLETAKDGLVSLLDRVDYRILAAGMIFSLVMGCLGGLIPALSAMRLKPLDAVR